MTLFADPVAEMRLLAACIDNPEYVLRLKPELFTVDAREDRQGLYVALRTSFLRYGDITTEGVENVLGRSLPTDLEVARGARPDPIVDRLVQLAMRRQLVDVQDRINGLISQPTLSITEVNNTLSITPLTAQSDTTLLSGSAEFASDLTRKRNGQYQFVDTGLRFLNFMLGGEWPRQGLTVVMGEGGAGKTALICNSMKLMAEMGLGSFFASLEMTKGRLYSRLVADQARIDGMRIKNGTVSDEELVRIDQAIEHLNALPIFIDDRPGMEIDTIIDQIRHHKERYNIHAVFVDYLQIIGGTYKGEENTSELYGYYAQLLRNAAVRYDLAVILLSQQNRGHSGLHSILGSGRVGHIADTVLELTRTPSPGPNRPIDINFHKNRDGDVGSQTVNYNAPFLRFTD